PAGSLEVSLTATNKEAYPRGEMRGNGRAIQFFTGPAIDPDTGAETEFVALDYRQPLLFGRRKMARILAEVEANLREHGGFKIEVLSPPAWATEPVRKP